MNRTLPALASIGALCAILIASTLAVPSAAQQKAPARGNHDWAPKVPPGKHHTLPASLDTVQWGWLDPREKPKLTINSGDTVSIETMMHSHDKIQPGTTMAHRAPMLADTGMKRFIAETSSRSAHGELPAIKSSMAGGRLPVYAKPQDEQAPPEQGYLAFVDNTVDVNTGTIKLKGLFENEHLKLWPGQFVRVTLRLATQANALVLPNQAIQTGQEGPYVYVVKEDRCVESRKVATGARLEQELVIEDGLKLGETVVLDGQLRLAPGMKVQIREPGSGPRGNRKKGAS